MALLRLHSDRRGRIIGIGNRDEINGEVLGGFAEARAGVGGVSVRIKQRFGHDGFGFGGWCVGIEKVLIANDQDTFRQAGYLFIGALDSFDDHRPGRAAEDLLLAEAVNVRVIPIETWRLVFRNAKFVLKWRVARLDGSLQDVVLVTDRWNGEAVKVEIGGGERHRVALARVRLFVGGSGGVSVMISGGGNGVGRVRQIVFQIQDEQVAWTEAQSRGLAAVRVKIAEANCAIWLGKVAHGQVHGQHAVVAAQIFRLRDGGAGGRARARSIRGFLGTDRRVPVDEPQARKDR